MHNLLPNVRYEFKVSAYNDIGNSTLSAASNTAVYNLSSASSAADDEEKMKLKYYIAGAAHPVGLIPPTDHVAVV